MDAQTATMPMMCCPACGALAEAKCTCGVDYEPLAQRTARREKASELYKQGLTMQEIADKLGVSQQTISNDLGDLPDIGKSKRPKTGTNPRGAGRPKGSKNKAPKAKRPPKQPGVKQAQRSINLLPEVWEQIKVRAAAADMPAAAFIGALLTATVDPEIDLKTLSKTAQDKVAAAIRQATKKLEREFEPRVQAEVKRRNEKIFPLLQQRENEAYRREKLYREYLQRTKKIMTIAEFTLVCSLLHPDSRISASEERLRRAFQMFEPKKFALTGEK